MPRVRDSGKRRLISNELEKRIMKKQRVKTKKCNSCKKRKVSKFSKEGVCGVCEIEDRRSKNGQ